MEQYIVSARKYRPSTFDSVVGQSALTATLKNAVATDRLAHAYLFCGSRGVGKTSCARIFAKTINCKHRTPDGEACNECDSCRAFNEGNSMNIIELDAASHNGIDDIKALVEQVQVPPTSGRYRVFIIDEVHMLSAAAFNAFLKTLEEPPAYVIFILATTEKHKIIPTILSRCQIYDFNRITIPDMMAHLQKVAASEGVTAEPAALNVIARQADGAMRDALSIFDQVAASSRGNITFQTTIDSLNVLDNSYYGRLVDAFLAEDIPAALLVFHEIRRKGFDAQFFLNGLGQYIRDLMLARDPSTLPLLDAPDDVRTAMATQAAKLTPKWIYSAMALCNDADLNYRTASNKQLLVEVTLIRIAQLLSPSPDDSGRGEGLIKPIKRREAAKATTAPETQTATPAAPSPRPGVAPARQAASPANPPAASSPQVQSHMPPRHVAGGLRVGAMSLHPDRRATENAAAQTTHGAPRTHSYTPDEVAAAWKAYIDANPSEKLLGNLMQEKIPRQEPSGIYTLELPSTVQMNLIEEHKTGILQFMRNKLSNDAFDFGLVKGVQEDSPRYWNDQRVLRHMLDNNADFREFYAEMKLAPR